ncbi:MAG: hypothetical protein RL220_1797 [Bacteroidota bacterium]
MVPLSKWLLLAAGICVCLSGQSQQPELNNFACTLRSAAELSSSEAKDIRSYIENHVGGTIRVIYDESSEQFAVITPQAFELCPLLTDLAHEGYFIGLIISPNSQQSGIEIQHCEGYRFELVRMRYLLSQSSQKDE